MLKVEMLSTGDEVLHGQIVDTNAAWLADYLFENGFPMTRRNTVGDNLDALVAILQERSQQADVVIVNGGLGPTSDDLSAEAAAKAAGVELELHEDWLAHMAQFFTSRGRVMAPSNRKQAMIPAGSEMVDNPIGTACGFAMTLNRAWIFFTPGVPSEFRQMIEQQIVPRLRQRYPQVEPPVCLRLTTFGRSESDLAQSLNALALPPEVVMGYRSSMPIIELKLTGPAKAREAMEALWPKVREVAGESLIFEGTEGLPAQLARRLQEKELRLSLSEQFTSGLLALQLRSAGAPLLDSEVLTDRDETLEETAQRAAALVQKAGSELTLLVGAMQDEQVNVVLCTPVGLHAARLQFSASRHALRTRQEVCAMMALTMLRRWLNETPVTAEQGWVRVVEAFSQ